jgi:esterase/lipase superfamily enzyme
LLYVPGTKVNFYSACAFAAQLDHFMGREMTAVAFSWPSRQNLVAYAFGGDAQRAYDSAQDLSHMLELLATKTEAENIHIITWSAGGRLVMSALSDLYKKSNLSEPEEIHKKYKIGTVYFAAADVPGEEFLAALPNIKKVANKILVTSSKKDDALKYGRLFMGGETRIGEVRKNISDTDLETVLGTSNLEVINVSEGVNERGFDITGHRYWFNHPWASSDIILAIRYGLSAQERELKHSKLPILWSIPKDYPEKLRGMKDKLDL